MIEFLKDQTGLLLCYTPDGPIDWMAKKLPYHEIVAVKKVYWFKLEDVVPFEDDEKDPDDFDFYDSDTIQFSFGLAEEGYYKIPGRHLKVPFDIYIDTSIQVEDRFFRGVNNLSIFRQIAKVMNEDIYITTSTEFGIPHSEFIALLDSFPNHYELSRYAQVRIDGALRPYFNVLKDYQAAYESYLNRKPSINGPDLSSLLVDAEYRKYKLVHEALTDMLQDVEAYNQSAWQSEILKILRIIFPKYIGVLKEAPIKDQLAGKMRSIDFMLVDTNGYVDIVEIKRPSASSIVSKRTYRDNHIPLKELSGTVMQLEKYIFHLNRWGELGENKLTKKYQSLLPQGMQIHIRNPKGLIIMGREQGLTNQQLDDLEIVKRKYTNVVDVLTYDDLIRRLQRQIAVYTPSST